jgi:hypothetical protein
MNKHFLIWAKPFIILGTVSKLKQTVQSKIRLVTRIHSIVKVQEILIVTKHKVGSIISVLDTTTASSTCAINNDILHLKCFKILKEETMLINILLTFTFSLLLFQ